MSHTHANDIYRQLGGKIDALSTRAPWNETFRELLQELYTPQEADVLVHMPFGPATLEQVARSTHQAEAPLRATLEALCEKGLVVDLWVKDRYRYMPAPLVVGIFEFTMMRTRGELRSAEWARLFDEYMQGTHDFYAANCGHGERVSVMRVVPHTDAIPESDYVEILDYEKAAAIVEDANRFAIGLCSCRHEKQQVGKQHCNTPLDTCSSFGISADVLIRHGMAREVSRSEMLENLARAKELKLVLTADNVQQKVGFMCQCCGCCCNVLLGVSQHGYANAVVTSTYLSKIDEDKCTGCEKCAKVCPIHAIQMVPIATQMGPIATQMGPTVNPPTKKPKNPRVDEAICLGCGVCALVCHKGAVRLAKRQQRVLHPATTFERVILASLERGTLQNQMFDDPHSLTQKFLRGFVGGFLRLPPVKQALLGDQLRSNFLRGMAAGIRLQNKGYVLEL